MSQHDGEVYYIGGTMDGRQEIIPARSCSNEFIRKVHLTDNYRRPNFHRLLENYRVQDPPWSQEIEEVYKLKLIAFNNRTNRKVFVGLYDG